MFIEDIVLIVEACIILHNMMVEERMNEGVVESDDFYNLDVEGMDDGQVGNEQENIAHDEVENNVEEFDECEWHHRSHDSSNMNAQNDQVNRWSHDRWDTLHDFNTFYKLRRSIMKELKHV